MLKRIKARSSAPSAVFSASFITIGDSQYLAPAAVMSKYGVGRQTLARWHAKGKLRAVTTPGGKHLYHAGDVHKLFHSRDPAATSAPVEKEVVLYARVSSEHQRGDLGRQIDDLKLAYAEHSHIYQDVASGLNWKRPGLLALLDRVHKGTVGAVVVSHRDRLARFGVELIEWIIRQADAKLVVLGNEDRGEGEHHDPDPERELADDLISIVTVFVAKHNGRRSADNRRRRKAAAAAAEAEAEGDSNGNQEVQVEEGDESIDTDQAPARQGQAHPGVPRQGTTGDASEVDWHGALDIQRVPQGGAKRRR